MKFASLVLMASLAAVPVAAQQAPASPDPYKIDFTQVLKDLDGNPYTECRKVDEKDATKCGDTQPVTLGRLVAEVLNKPLKSDETATLDDILTRNRLARQVYTQATSLTASEKTIIENRMIKFSLDALEVGAAIAILDPPQIK